MQNWHFQISGYLSVQGSSQTMRIRPENIAYLIKISNYMEEHMPLYFAKMSLDKNLFDIIANNAKTATLHLKIEKFDKQDETTQAMYYPYIEDDFLIYIAKDINYSKEIDYKEAEVTGDKTREDVYTSVDIGLISKASIDANKVLVCGTMYKSNLMDIAAYYLSGTHLLLEPFDYNPQQEQLIIPPQETLVNVVSFLDNIKVFYKSQYLFFIDEPYCTYLISRSGRGVEKKDEVYNDVYLHIRAKDDPQAAVPGMMIDTTNSCYYLDVNSGSTNYTIDHDTAKVVNKTKVIINPNKQNDPILSTNLKNAANTINSIINKFTSGISNFGNLVSKSVNDINQKIYKVNEITRQLNNLTAETVNLNSLAIATMVTIPTQIDIGTKTPVIIPALPSAISVAAISAMNSYTSQMNSLLSPVNQVAKDFSPTSYNAINRMHEISCAANAVSGCSFIDAQDGIASTTKYLNSMQSSASTLSTTMSGVSARGVYPTQLADKSTLNLQEIQNIMNTLQSVANSIPGGVSNSGITAVLNGLESFKEYNTTMTAISSQMNQHAANENSILKNVDGTCKDVSTQATSSASCKTQLNSILTMNTRSQVKSITPVLNTINSTVKSVSSTFSQLKSVASSVSKAINTISTSSLLNIGSNLNALGDLTGMGKSGLSVIETSLKVGGGIGNAVKDGFTLIKINNDNENKIKNEQSELQNKINQLTLQKQDLDPSIFTPNKKYTVKNYDGHANKDGLFLLNSKVESFVRQDNTFKCNVLLRFARLIDDSTTDTGTGATDTQATQIKEVQIPQPTPATVPTGTSSTSITDYMTSCNTSCMK